MSEEEVIRESSTARGGGALKRFGIYLAVIVGVFLIGFVPMWMIAKGRESERDTALRDLRLSRIQNSLATAAIDARRGEYEPARVAARDFYTNLRAELDRESESALTSQQRATVQPLFTDRDEVITLLARSDPSAADRLTSLYVTFSRAIVVASPGQSPSR